VLQWFTGHCNRAAVSRNRYGVEKTVDTHKILINAITFMFLFKKYDRQNHVWSFMTKYLRFLWKFTSWRGETPTGNFTDVFLSWTSGRTAKTMESEKEKWGNCGKTFDLKGKSYDRICSIVHLFTTICLRIYVNVPNMAIDPNKDISKTRQVHVK
jgi:hypothetical protein